MVRRDKLGRVIGYNWWREYIMSIYSPARDQWEVQFDLKANNTYRRGIIAKAERASRRGGRNEIMDYVEEFPPPTLRAYLEAEAGRGCSGRSGRSGFSGRSLEGDERSEDDEHRTD